ncbi:MAG: hypothetical protein JWO62_668, partial [Acidimicrobiaceae bacterium]|nr:hypothetical protein [Acidimicrobiaceae bacterium]
EVSNNLPDTDAPTDNEFANTDHQDDGSSHDAGQDEDTDSSPGAGQGANHATGGGRGGLGLGMGNGHSKRSNDRHTGGSAGPRIGRQTRLRSYVVEADEDEGARGTVGDEAPDLSPIDVAGVARVLKHERNCGREPREMAHSNAGFDVESFDKGGELVRRIEIKSTGGQWSIAGVMLSRRQHRQAVEDGNLFWLYVVENAQDEGYKIYRIQNPASRIDYFGFDGGWKEVAEPDVERDEAGTPTAPSTRNLLRRSPGQSWTG